MVDLRTTWLGLPLASPIILGASPLSHDVEVAARAVEAGAGAVVMYSLFEEQVVNEQMAAHHFIDAHANGDAEASGFLPDVDVFSLGAEPYLRQLQRLRAVLKVPVIASLNGTTPGGWTEYARACEARGADAIELNLYDVVTSMDEGAKRVEDRQIAVVESVTHAVDIPVTVKIGPFYTSVPAFAKRLEAVGAHGITLFNWPSKEDGRIGLAYLIINFLVLAFLIHRLILRKLISDNQVRHDDIKRQVDEAATALREAQSVIADSSIASATRASSAPPLPEA